MVTATAIMVVATVRHLLQLRIGAVPTGGITAGVTIGVVRMAATIATKLGASR